MVISQATKLPREKNMSNKGQLLQDPFLNTLRKEHVPVSIYLVNGIKLQGQIESFDQYVVLLRNSVTQMVYKHAISTVVPSRPISLGPDKEAEQTGCRFPARPPRRARRSPGGDHRLPRLRRRPLRGKRRGSGAPGAERRRSSLPGSERQTVQTRPPALCRPGQGRRDPPAGRGVQCDVRGVQSRAFPPAEADLRNRIK